MSAAVEGRLWRHTWCDMLEMFHTSELWSIIYRLYFMFSYIYLFIYCSYIFKTWEKERNRVQGFCHQKISYSHPHCFTQINSVLLARVVHEILRMQADKTSHLERVRQGVKACVVLFPLLGLTWVFGVLSVTDAGLVFQYIFTIFNSLQVLDNPTC